MTKKPYPIAPPVSRARHRSPRSHSTSRPPSSDAFAVLDPGDEDHPVDSMVDRIPSIARRSRRLRQLATKVQRRLADTELFLAYEDLRGEQQVAREEIYFNAGFENGRLVGRASFRLPLANPAIKELADRLRAVLAKTTAPTADTAAVLMSYAHALLVPVAPSGSPRSTTARRLRRTKEVRR